MIDKRDNVVFHPAYGARFEKWRRKVEEMERLHSELLRQRIDNMFLSDMPQVLSPPDPVANGPDG